MNASEHPTFVGPHEGQELRLMTRGVKPLCMFVEDVRDETRFFDEASFDRLVTHGSLVKKVHVGVANGRSATNVRRILYALAAEQWRIEAMILVQTIYGRPPFGFRPDLERLAGALLGYDSNDVESFIEWFLERDVQRTHDLNPR